MRIVLQGKLLCEANLCEEATEVIVLVLNLHLNVECPDGELLGYIEGPGVGIVNIGLNRT